MSRTRSASVVASRFVTDIHDERVATFPMVSSMLSEKSRVAEPDAVDLQSGVTSYLQVHPWMDASQLGRRIVAVRENPEPFAMLSFSIGDAIFLGAPDIFTPVEYEERIRQVFGQVLPDSRLFKNLQSDLAQALRSGDVVGIPPCNGEGTGFRTRLVLAQRQLLGRGAALTNKASQQAWFLDGGLNDLLTRQAYVGLIGSCDLRTAVRRRFDVARVDQWMVPSAPDTTFHRWMMPHFPDRYDELRQLIKVPFAGALFLIDAGFMGKAYAHWIKQQGGIALEVEHLFDVWGGRFAAASNLSADQSACVLVNPSEVQPNLATLFDELVKDRSLPRYYEVVRVLEQSNQRGLAAELMTHAVSQYPGDGDVCYRASVLYYAFGQFQTALEFAAKAVELSPNDSRFQEHYAKALERIGGAWNDIDTIARSLVDLPNLPVLEEQLGALGVGLAARQLSNEGAILAKPNGSPSLWGAEMGVSKQLSKKIAENEVDGKALKEKMRLPASTNNYIIFFTPRSGSSWLTDILSKTRELGSPEEWFNPSFTAAISKAIGVRRPLDYIKILRRIRKTPNKVFGSEVTYFQYRTIDGFDLIDILDRPHIFYLRRRDLIKQGISLYRAVASQHYHNTTDMSEAERKSIDQKAPYDVEKIRYWVEHILQQEIGLEQMLAERDLSALRLFYEDIVGEQAKVLRIFYKHILGVGEPELIMSNSHHRPISSDATRLTQQRFVDENAQWIAELEDRRPPLV